MSEAIYDRKVNDIIDGLSKGKTREQLAEEFGHANWKSIDQHMRRRHFTWNRGRNMYYPKEDVLDKVLSSTLSSMSVKAESVIQKLTK